METKGEVKIMTKRQNRVATVTVAIFALLCGISAMAEMWTQNKSVERYEDKASYDMSYWNNSSGIAGTETTELDDNADYRTAKTFRIYSTDRVFPANSSLTVQDGGIISFTGGGSFTCNNLILENGAKIQEYEYMSDTPQKSGYPHVAKRFYGIRSIQQQRSRLIFIHLTVAGA